MQQSSSHSDSGAVFREPELIVLTLLAFLSRFLTLFEPRVVLWDEIHFIRYTSFYFTGQYYIDVHPPLGKLLFYGAARLLGISPGVLAATQAAPQLRILPALAGALLIPVVYLLIRELNGNRKVALFAAGLLLVDNALLAISRIIVMDSMLFLFGMLAVLLFCAGENRLGRMRWTMFALSAVFAGLAAGIKWTGLSALGLIAMTWMADVISQRRRGRTIVAEAALYMIVPLVVYTIPFAIHFALLKQSGPLSVRMSPEFQATLAGNPLYRPGAHIAFLDALADLHRVMMSINIGWASDVNASASKWYTWPISRHPIRFFSLDESISSVRWILLFGNPMVWWSVIGGMTATAIAAVVKSPLIERHRRVLTFLAAGYAINFIPFAFIQRPMYLYHYFFALIYGVMLAAFGLGALMGWLDERREAWSFPNIDSKALYFGIVGLSACLFLYLSPLSYGTSLSWSANRHRFFMLARRTSVLRDTYPPPE